MTESNPVDRERIQRALAPPHTTLAHSGCAAPQLSRGASTAASAPRLTRPRFPSTAPPLGLGGTLPAPPCGG